MIWYSGGQYHVLYDYPDDRVGYHLTSLDGIHDWTDQGLAYDPRFAQQIFSYTDGTVDHWYKMERPACLIEKRPRYACDLRGVRRGQEQSDLGRLGPWQQGHRHAVRWRDLRRRDGCRGSWGRGRELGDGWSWRE